MISLNTIKKSFGSTLVIPPLDIKFEEGKTHVLLGPSGCGKTTLLRMISGLSSPDSGEVRVGGKTIESYSQTQLTEKLGYVSQEGGLFPHLSAKRNVLLPAKIRGKKNPDIVRRMEKFAKMMDLDLSLLKRFPRQLSGGQKQRVALMRGLILDPDVVLLDEPLSALDPVVRMKLQIQLKEIFQKLKKTVILVSHDLHEASFLGDRINLLNKGSVVQSGSFKSLYEKPKNQFVEEFLSAQLPMELLK